jgi:hypothetical protein
MDGTNQMSILVMTRVFAKRFGSCTRKAIAVKLADHADDEGKGIWPSLSRLAASCDVSEATVRRTLAEFVSEGLLTLVKEGGRGPGSTNRYDFDLAVLKAMPGALESLQPANNKGITMTPLETAKGITDDAKGITDDEKGCHGDTQTIIEPSDNHHSQPRARDLPPDGGEREGEEDREGRKAAEREFKRFGPTWPTWVQDSEPEARRKWMALPAGERERAVELAPVYLAAERSSGRTKTCSLSVYLGERRWEKLPASTVKAATGQRHELPAFGKAWMAWRLQLLATLPARQWQPTAAQRALIASGNGHLFDDNRRHAKYPLVHALDIDAERGLGRRLKPGEQAPDAETYVRIKRGSEEWNAWAQWHHERDWPWINPPKHVEWVFLPSAFPAPEMAMQSEATGTEVAA